MKTPSTPPTPINIVLSPMTKWQCHKTVRADKISRIEDIGHNQHRLTCGEDTTAPVVVVLDTWITKHRPKVGDYLVQYEDDYLSCSPPEAFEAGYRIANNYQDRVRIEHADLSYKIEKLSDYLAQVDESQHQNYEIRILFEQRSVMLHYQRILADRIHNFGPPIPDAA